MEAEIAGLAVPPAAVPVVGGTLPESELAGKSECMCSCSVCDTLPLYMHSTADIQSLYFARYMILSLPEKPILSGIENKKVLVILLPFLDHFFTCHSDAVCVIIYNNFRTEGNETSMVGI